MSRQETLLKEIIKGGGPPRGKQISPRNSDVELVNQKIDNAKRKMSRYFAARNNMQGAVGTKGGPASAASHGETKSFTHLSMEMVRLGSPFFDVSQIINSPAMNSKRDDSESEATS